MSDQQENSLTPSKWFSSPPAFRFKVPVYQRLFTWGEAQFDRLLDDLTEHFKDESNQPYYLGIITVVNREGKVVNREGERILIDGQQRLTVITILTAMLRNANDDFPDNIRDYIDYEARPDDRESLTKIWVNGPSWFNRLEEELQKILEVENISSRSMCEFIMHIKRNGDKWSSLWAKAKERLTLLVSLLPPEYTNDFKLQNEYFEKMNSAGKQLEPHEILKVRICEKNEDFDIWNAIEDFTVKYGGYKDGGTCTDSPVCLLTAILKDDNGWTKNGMKDSIEKWRPSLIDFPMFLLHVQNIASKGRLEKIPSDSHKLLECFGCTPDKGLFLKTMRKYRAFLDQWIIHKEVASDMVQDEEGADNSQFKYWTQDGTYEVTHIDGVDVEKTENRLYMNLKQLQMALYAFEGDSQRWLIEAYNYCNNGEDSNSDVQTITIAEKLYCGLLKYLMKKTSFFGEDLSLCSEFEGKTIADNTITYHRTRNRADFVYLDYLLWLLAGEKMVGDLGIFCEIPQEAMRAIKAFLPRANRSIEHFHPQTDIFSEVSLRKVWGEPLAKNSDDQVKDIFGNLALISAGRNSEFSNWPVNEKSAKIDRLVKRESIESIKLLLMRYDCDGKDEQWTPDKARQHANKMLKVIKWGAELITSENMANVFAEL